MKRHQLHGPTKPGRNTGLVVLLTLIFFATLVLSATAGLSQENGISPVAGPAIPLARPANSGASSASQAAPQQSAPNRTPFSFLRLGAVLCSGLVISAARLARKFRLFFGLGVFANPYAVLFLIFGVGICGIPVTSESILKGLPMFGDLGPWIADLSGIVVALVLPAIRFKPKTSPSGEGAMRDLEAGSSSNPIVEVIENAIKERILQRMQKEVVAASGRYDWRAIKVAARRALEEEMTIRPLPNETYQAVLLKIESFQPDPDAREDSEKKYLALTGLLSWCSFKRLLNGLNAAASETQA
jgi:hypothetical protein